MNLPLDMSLWDWFKSKIVADRPTRSRKPEHAIVPTARILDLHGMTVHQAFEQCRWFITETRNSGIRSCLIITGRSGDIAREFPLWADLNDDVIIAVPQNGGGSFRVSLRR